MSGALTDLNITELKRTYNVNTHTHTHNIMTVGEGKVWRAERGVEEGGS